MTGLVKGFCSRDSSGVQELRLVLTRSWQRLGGWQEVIVGGMGGADCKGWKGKCGGFSLG